MAQKQKMLEITNYGLQTADKAITGCAKVTLHFALYFEVNDTLAFLIRTLLLQRNVRNNIKF